MKKMNFLFVVLIMGIVTVGCGKQNVQNQKVNKKSEEMTPYKMVNSEKDNLWFKVSNLDKDAVIKSAYVFNNGSVTTYNGLNNSSEGEEITLGDITKLEPKEISNKINKTYIENKKNEYEYTINHLEEYLVAIPQNEGYIDAKKNTDDSYKAELAQGVDERIEKYKKTVEILKKTKNDDSKSREVIEIKAITDGTGNTTTSEEVTVPITFISENNEIVESDLTFKMNDNIQGIIIYDKTFSGFRLAEEEYLIQLENDGTVKYGWDGPKTKGITVE